MKKIVSVLMVMFLVTFSVPSYADVILHNLGASQAGRVFNDLDLTREISGKYSVMELPNGEHDGKEYGVIKLGEFTQSANSEVRSPIEWYILEKKNGMAVLMTKHIIAYHPYDGNSYMDWNDTMIKKWFDTMLFEMTAGEREMLSPNPYRNVGKIFLMTANEANYYFAGNRIGLLDAVPTDYATVSGSTSSFWLENDNSHGGDFAPCVNGRTATGTPNIEFVPVVKHLGVRPCIMVKYETDSALQANLQVETELGLNTNAGLYNVTTAIKNVSQIATDAQLFTYNTVEDGQAKSFYIEVQLPICSSDDSEMANKLNTLIKSSGYEVLKMQISSFIEDNLGMLKNQFTVSVGVITSNADNTYTIAYQIKNKLLCKIKYNPNNGSCIVTQ